jgi:hypothetical protein
MAVAFGASGRYLRRTANLPSSTSFTIAAWIKVVGVRGAYAYILGMDDGSGAYTLLGYSAADVLEVTTDAAYASFASNPTVGNWAFMALTCSGSGAGQCAGYFRDIGASTFVSVTTTASNSTKTALNIGNDGYDDWTNTQVGPIFVFDRALSSTELLHLSYSIRPNVIGTMPIIWSPCWSTADTNDYSGNGDNWTTAGALSSADNPPISWGMAPWVVQYVTSSGTTYNQSAGGTLTTAGATVRSTRKVAAGTLTTAGALAKRAAKSVVGTLTTAGTLTRKANKVLAGTLTPAGTLVSSRLYSQVLAGTLTTAGVLAKRTSKSLAGTLTTAGAIVRSAAKSLAGTLTTAGGLVADYVSGSATFSQVVGGTLTTAGALAKRTSKSLAGTLTSDGSISKAIRKVLSGALTTAGALVRDWFSPSAAKVDVTLTDALTYTCTLTDARAYTCTAADALTYRVSLGDSTT